jgi:hypothetical protein
VHLTGVEVEIRPGQPAQLTLPRTAVECQTVERARLTATRLSGLKKGSGLTRRPTLLAGVLALVTRLSRPLQADGDVVRNEVVAHRLRERRIEDGVMQGQRRG